MTKTNVEEFLADLKDVCEEHMLKLAPGDDGVLVVEAIDHFAAYEIELEEIARASTSSSDIPAEWTVDASGDAEVAS